MFDCYTVNELFMSKDVCLTQVVEDLCIHGGVIGGKIRFATALGTPVGKKIQWEERYSIRSPSYGCHEHFSNLLEDWVERQGSGATLGELGLILRQCEFMAAAGKVLRTFNSHCNQFTHTAINNIL